MVVFAGYTGFLHYLQLACYESATIGINVTKNKIPKKEVNAGLENKIFPREPNCIFKSHLQVLCIETSTFLGSLQKFEGAAPEFKGAIGS